MTYKSLLVKFDKFEEIYPVARRAKKIALLFSPFSCSLELKDGEFDVIDDVTSVLGTYVFTDGCGLQRRYRNCTTSHTHPVLLK